VNVLVWHRHGSWLTAFVQGTHRYLLPVVPGRGPDGRGRARTWDWPASAVEVAPAQLRDERVDLVVLQDARDLELARRWLGREPGVDVPAVWLEHDTPPDVLTRHPVADRRDIPVVHVTAFNAVAWDNGLADTRVVEHGVVDPGARWTGEIAHAAVVVNEPVRRGRIVGTDLLPRFAAAGVDLDVFGMQVTGLADHLGVDRERLAAHEDLPQGAMHGALARRGVYLHLTRWTSLGLSLIEAMMLGMPVVVLASTEAVRAVPPAAGVISTDPDELVDAACSLLADPRAAADAGSHARRAALERYHVQRFLTDWDRVLEEVTA
jgi:hypothetical protein